MSDTPYSIIATRRNHKLSEKSETYKLLADSYKGGIDYIRGGHLFPHDREWKKAFEKRKERTPYINFLQPIVDILIGFIFKDEPSREIPPDLEAITKRTSKQKNMDAYMRSVATHSCMYTVLVAVDSPAFDPEVVKTEADRIAANLQPYACTYMPWQIRDFACDADMNLEWVLLDDTRVEKADPLKEPVKRVIYRLWTKKDFSDFEIKENQNTKKIEVVLLEGYPKLHSLGEVPCHFVNWRDLEDDHVSDSPMEDIAILSRTIYNIMSYLEEMLASGTFKTLFFPVKTAGDVPQEIKKAGLSESPLVEFDGNMSKQPFFDGAKLEEIDPFIAAYNLYKLQIFTKVGMDVDRDKSYVQSGAAIGKEFQKTEALLKAGSEAMEQCEEFIYRIAAKWQNQNYSEDQIKVEYCEDFQQADIDAEFVRLKAMYDMALPDVSRLALREMVKLQFPDENAEQLSNQEWKREPQGSFVSDAETQPTRTEVPA